MLWALTALLAFQLAGEALVAWLQLPAPGPVVGMALLFIALIIRGGAPKALAETSRGLLSHLSLMFVPAGVGVTLHLTVLADSGAVIGVALFVSTLAAIAVTGLAMTWAMRLSKRKGSQE
jgi:holin-like protein